MQFLFLHTEHRTCRACGVATVKRIRKVVEERIPPQLQLVQLNTSTGEALLAKVQESDIKQPTASAVEMARTALAWWRNRLEAEQLSERVLS